MININRFIVTALLALPLSTAIYADQDIDHIGFLGINTVVYTVSRISPNKFTLVADTSNGPSGNELLGVYKGRAARLCKSHQFKRFTANYKISTATYMGEFNAFMRVPMTAPKIVGTVTCS